MTDKEMLFLNTLSERLRIWYRKEIAKAPRNEWTDDKIFNTYKFCNVFRWQDRCSATLYELCATLHLQNWQRAVLRWTGNTDMCKAYYNFAMQRGVAADHLQFAKDLQTAQRMAGCKLATGSFIVNRYGDDVKQMTGIAEAADEIDMALREHHVTTLHDYISAWRDESKKRGILFADFTAGCVAYDYVATEPTLFTDLYTYAPLGPGAKNGLRHIYGSKRMEYAVSLSQLVRDCADKIAVYATDGHPDVIVGYLKAYSVFDAEHWLCEYFKYVRGYSKNMYVPYGGK